MSCIGFPKSPGFENPGYPGLTRAKFRATRVPGTGTVEKNLVKKVEILLHLVIEELHKSQHLFSVSIQKVITKENQHAQ